MRGQGGEVRGQRQGAGIQSYGQSFETVQLRRDSHLGWLGW